MEKHGGALLRLVSSSCPLQPQILSHSSRRGCLFSSWLFLELSERGKPGKGMGLGAPWSNGVVPVHGSDMERDEISNPNHSAIL